MKTQRKRWENQQLLRHPQFAVSMALKQEQRNRSRSPGGARAGGDSAIRPGISGRGCGADPAAVPGLRPVPSAALGALPVPGCAPPHTRSFPLPQRRLPLVRLRVLKAETAPLCACALDRALPAVTAGAGSRGDAECEERGDRAAHPASAVCT